MELFLVGGAVALLVALGRKPAEVTAKIPKPSAGNEENLLPTRKASDVLKQIVPPAPGHPDTGVYLKPKEIIEYEAPVKVAKPVKVVSGITIRTVGQTDDYYTGTKKSLKV